MNWKRDPCWKKKNFVNVYVDFSKNSICTEMERYINPHNIMDRKSDEASRDSKSDCFN